MSSGCIALGFYIHHINKVHRNLLYLYNIILIITLERLQISSTKVKMTAVRGVILFLRDFFPLPFIIRSDEFHHFPCPHNITFFILLCVHPLRTVRVRVLRSQPATYIYIHTHIEYSKRPTANTRPTYVRSGYNNVTDACRYSYTLYCACVCDLHTRTHAHS